MCGVGNAFYVEVLVAQVQPTFFMRILGINNATVTARAVAELTGKGGTSGCIYTLDSNPSDDGIRLDGNGTIAAGTTCGIVDNSTLTLNGSKGSITGGSISAVSIKGGSCSPPNCNPAAISPIVPQPDPLAYLTPPPTTGPCLADPSISEGKKAKQTMPIILPGIIAMGSIYR